MTISTAKPPLKAAKEYSAEEFPQYPSGEQFWTESANHERKIHYATRGHASQAETPAITVCAALALAANKHPNQLALVQEDPKRVAVATDSSAPPSLPLNECKTWTWSMYLEDVRKCAKAMRSVGFVQFDTCSIFGFNSPEWAISSIAGMFAGGKSSGIYPTDTAEQFWYKVLHSNTSVVFIETLRHLDMVSSVIDQLPYVKAVVVWGEVPQISTLGEHCTVWSWDAFLAEAAKVTDQELDLIVNEVKPGHCSTLVYTSGTTGQPKAVMVAHDSEVFVARTAVVHGVGSIALDVNVQERVLSYLPLSHIAGKMIDIIVPLTVTAVLPGYATTYFARSYDLKLGTLVERVKWTRPTVFLGVPRVWEKIAEKMKQVGAKTKGVKRRIATWAKRKGMAYQENIQLGGSGKKPFMYGLANKLVLSKVKLALGLDQVKFALAGAAPMTLDTLRFFGNLGININEVYGMSESTGVISWSNDQCHIWGTVGFTLPGMDVKILRPGGAGECPRAKTLTQAPDECQGEICYRGRHVMMGYLANPLLGEEHVAEIRKKNEEAIDADGWLHSGDMGIKTDTGMIKITGRYKELIIGAGGENIAPVPIEDEIKRLGAGLISNVQMIGDKRKYNVALLTLTCKGATGERPGTTELEQVIKEKFPGLNTIEDACKSPEFITFVESIIKVTNANGSVCPSNAAVIGKFTILPQDYSVETEELTATLKLKRSVVEQKYAAALEAMYEDTSKAMFFNHNQ